MSMDYPAVLNLKTEAIPYSWTDREVMLYVLGIGMGSDSLKKTSCSLSATRHLHDPNL